ncbi:hypothetical protein KORDIASMS9_02516 [Kordia sp. SMS9]|uniref:hypothetical protein n=1 Tax=Kordia sp. SMS9 TaxID=2282170 RepID=UPI000E0D140B|nr:hypothetical protein [Kordia sp. SMS9]AXG70277.1 hypothetical protein KORDIASMS9_02516 [Kordia sp. SMS9]
MKCKQLLRVALSLVFFSCEISISPALKTPSHITIESEGLTTTAVTVENHLGNKKTSEFIYGEACNVVFNNMKGFIATENLVYPEMDIYVINKKGDTLLNEQNLLKNQDINFQKEKLSLESYILIAKPMFAGNEYLMHVNITDTKSDHFYNIRMPFSVIENPLFTTKSSGITYDSMYLYSKQRDVGIVDDKISMEEDIYIILNNFKGLKVDENGMVDITSSLSLKDATGTKIIEKENMSPALLNAASVQQQFSPYIVITSGIVTNPITCELKVKDNRSDAFFETRFELIVE